jgi:hypothetical protein
VVTLRATWACRCGREREVVAANVRTDLPLDTPWRPAGPCRACGWHGDAFRIETTDRAYRIRIERG